MSDKSTSIICTYCGEKKFTLNEDHIPPQCIIDSNHNHKVPSCIKCNGGSSKDDEYFSFAVSMAKSCDGHPKISKVREKIFESLGKVEAQKYRDLILRNVNSPSHVEYKLDFGNYLERIRLVTSRIIKGLFYLQNNKSRIPDTYQITVFVGNEYKAYGSQNTEKFQSLFKPLLIAEEHHVGESGVFDYLFSKIDVEDPYATVWYLRFYGGYELFAHCLQDGDSRALKTHFPPIHNMHLLPKLATIFVPSCGELSDWLFQQLGEKIKNTKRKEKTFPMGVIPIFHGKLGKYEGSGKK